MKYYKVGQPKNAVIFERADTDHIVGQFGVGLKSYLDVVSDPTEWAKYKSVPEVQWSSTGAGETSTCTNQSLCEIYERFINYYYQNDLFAKETKDFLEKEGYIVNGRCDLSESALAVWSGTDRNRGNSLKVNCDTARKKGLVPESRHKDDFTSEDAFWRIPTKEMEDLGLEFIKHIGMDHAWLFSDLTEYNKGYYDYMASQLKHSLVYSAIPVCAGWNNAVVPYDGRKDAGHAVVVVNFTGDSYISDSYLPMDKTLTNNYLINYGMKVVVYPLKKKEAINIEEISKEFLDNPPLGVPNSTVKFGEWFEQRYNRKPTQQELLIYMTIRESYLFVETTPDTGWVEKLISFIKGLIK